ncbi:MAG: type II toxin-antitoxin system YafQ family toxin [Rikenellaceae bacterium]|nr:type II toxin-antitoxin system YafQ family toxin [Rikenellaceae bacterium]
MKYEISYTNRFKQSLKKCVKRGLDIECLKNVINILQETGSLPSKYKPHKLKGNYSGCWECHIQPDWLLIWQQNDTELRLIFIDTGTHSDVF